MTNELHHWVGLSLAPGLGPATIRKLLDVFHSPGHVFAAAQAELSGATGLPAAQLDGLLRSRELLEAAQTEIERLKRLGGRPLSLVDPDYPEQLRQTAQPPPVLYVRGDTALLNRPAVAIVGSRSATTYGRRTAANLARDLGRRGVTVISGLAVGIDAAAHLGCLDGDGATVGVLGCGLDVVYPRTNRELYDEISGRGLLVSEYLLGTKPDGFRFPARNRIIAGLCRGVVVVEAARKSGSMITVQFALDEGREVGAVPGQVDSVKSSGTHWLLQQGASLIISAEDVLQMLGLDGAREPAGSKSTPERTGVSGASRELLELIETYPMSRQELLSRSGLDAPRLSELLLLLELEAAIELLPGDRVRKLG